MESIVFAGGCFWGVEAYFKQIRGVSDTRVGYIDGYKANPTYEEVCNGSGHAEAVEVTFDPGVVSLRTLIKHYLNIVDPTSLNRQGPDIGIQYRLGMYNFSQRDRHIIDDVLREERERLKQPLQIDLKQSSNFYEAEEEHQDYLDKNPSGYCHVDLSSVTNVEE